MANPYQILRIQRDATPAQIDDAYYRMRRLVSYGGQVKEEALNLAYAILSDPQRRARIDHALQRRHPRMPPAVPMARPASTASGGGRRAGGWLHKLLPFV